MDVPPPEEPTHLRHGTPEYRRTSLVLFIAGLMAFAMLYVAQGILPDVSRDFSVSPAMASLTLSLTTLPLAVAVLVAASWSEGQGRRRLLVGAVLSAAVLTLAASVAPSFGSLIVLRVLTGLVLAGLPAVAMAYVAEEFHPSRLATASTNLTARAFNSGSIIFGMFYILPTQKDAASNRGCFYVCQEASSGGDAVSVRWICRVT